MDGGISGGNNLKNTMIISAVVLMCFVLQTTSGFECYKCSYSIWSEGSQTNCVDNPESLSDGDRLYCNSTSYCVFQERYRLSDHKVISFFRTCSGTSWGNKCDPSPSHLTCKGSCQGDFCNVNDRGDKHVIYLETHKGYPFGNGGARTVIWQYSLTLCVVSFALILFL